MTTVTGKQAIEAAELTGVALHKCADPTEGARVVTVDEAREIAKADASLIWCEADTCFCHGCGEQVVRAMATHHNGDWYCDECEAAPSEE